MGMEKYPYGCYGRGYVKVSLGTLRQTNVVSVPGTKIFTDYRQTLLAMNVAAYYKIN